MKESFKPQVYEVDLYLRISKENQAESDSILNQRDLLLAYLEKNTDLRLHKIRIDAGYSGVHFERPAFQEMMRDIREGKTNCVLVKDLSRFGRNYIEVGRYIEKIFPYLGVRLIAVNDHFDTAKDSPNHIIVPFKNLINDAYSRDISMKIRTNLEVKRRRGEYVGAFAPYGYQKSETDKHQLVMDEIAAQTVRDIFKLYLQGMSTYKIAEVLNAGGVLTPLAYKKSLGSRFSTGFSSGACSQWTHVTVMRILKNPIYTGMLIQGKTTTPNYKVKKRIQKPQKAWHCVKDRHALLISVDKYDSVQKLLRQDTRTAVGEKTLHALAGIFQCGDCGYTMSRKSVLAKNKRYSYYVCGNYKYNKTCRAHSIATEQAEECVRILASTWLAFVADTKQGLQAVPCCGQFKLSRALTVQLFDKILVWERKGERGRCLEVWFRDWEADIGKA